MPVIHIRSDHRIDMNIFEGIPVIPSVSLPSEIREAIGTIISPAMLEEFNAIQGVTDEILAPLKQGYLNIFIGRNELEKTT